LELLAEVGLSRVEGADAEHLHRISRGAARWVPAGVWLSNPVDREWRPSDEAWSGARQFRVSVLERFEPHRSGGGGLRHHPGASGQDGCIAITRAAEGNFSPP